MAAAKDQTEQAFLSNYNIHDYDVPMLSVDVVIFSLRDNRLQVLLVKRADHPAQGMWSIPGGFVDIHGDADLDGAAQRKLEEKTGVRTPYLEQLETLGNGSRDPRGWSVTVVYFALINSDQVVLANDSPAKWVPVDAPQLRDLAFDHTQIFDNALERLRNKVAYTALPVHLLPDEFTLTDLKEVFEVILERKVEKSAFRRRIKEGDIVEPIEGRMRLGSNRPAQLYRLKHGRDAFFFPRNLMGPRK